MKYYGRAPLRIGLAGGGSDIVEHFSRHGGAVLNITINNYAHVFIEKNDVGKLIFQSHDLGKTENYTDLKDCENLIDKSNLKLHLGALTFISKKYSLNFNSLTISSYVDAPPGSGLGSSSTLMVAIIGSLLEFSKISISKYDLALLAYEIERDHLGLKGGMQDQFSASFGGCNLIEFKKFDDIKVNEVKLSNQFIREFEYSFSLFDLGKSRDSSTIIESQIAGMKTKSNLEDLNYLKEKAYEMKVLVEDGNLLEINNIIQSSWLRKKMLSSKISSKYIDELIDTIYSNGGISCKISGAGGGGFIFVGTPPEKKMSLIKTLKNKYGVEYKNFKIEKEGFLGHFRKF